MRPAPVWSLEKELTEPPNASRASPSALQGLVSGKEPLGFFLLGNSFFVEKMEKVA